MGDLFVDTPINDLDVICSRCGNHLNGHAEMEPNTKPPSKGDVSICIYCLSLAYFDGKGGLIEPTQEEYRLLMARDDVLMGLSLITHVLIEHARG